MKKFKYALDSLIKLRAYEKKEAENALAVLLKKEQTLKESIIFIKEDIGNEPSVKSLEDLFYKDSYSTRLYQKISEAQKNLQSLEEPKEEAKQIFIEKYKKVLALENLKTRKKQAYHLEYKRHEVQFLDDLSSSRHQFIKKDTF